MTNLKPRRYVITRGILSKATEARSGHTNNTDEELTCVMVVTALTCRRNPWPVV